MTHYRHELEKQAQQYHNYMIAEQFKNPLQKNPEKRFHYEEWIYATVAVGWILFFLNIFWQD